MPFSSAVDRQLNEKKNTFVNGMIIVKPNSTCVIIDSHVYSLFVQTNLGQRYYAINRGAKV